MDFTRATPTFVGPRVMLRVMEKRDATQQYADWLNDPEVNRYLATKGATIGELRAYVEQKHLQPDALFFGIFLRSNGAHIGTVKLEPIELAAKRATIAVMIGDKASWGQGYAREAMQLLIDWCFGALACDEVILGVASKNSAAVRLYEKLGFREISREPNTSRYGPEVQDQVWMTLQRAERNQ
jgi:RimJ/RimL family protein N-acetyltransferase